MLMTSNSCFFLFFSAILQLQRSLLLEFNNLHRDPEAHVENFVELCVPRYGDMQFHGHFRMSPSTYELLVQWIAKDMPKERTITIDKAVLTTLWYIGNGETYRSISDRFGYLYETTMRRKVMEVCKILVKRCQEYIKWPSSVAKMQTLAAEFKERCGFPGVVGAIDGTHIPILCPNEFRDSYIDRNGRASLQLQIVTDFSLRFIHVYTGYPGSVHDARVWRNCDLKGLLDRNNLPNDMHILGDSAYPLEPYLLVPFRNDGHLDAIRKRFNKDHSSTRVEAERSIGLLKGKWRRLKYLEMRDLDGMQDIIISACVLHNFVIEHNGVEEGDIEPMDGSDSEDDGDSHSQQQGNAGNGQAKRLDIANFLFS